MPRIRGTEIVYEDPYMTLQLACWADELSPAQLQAFDKAEKEHRNIQVKLKDIVSNAGGENIYLGEIFSAYQVPGTAPGIEAIGKPVAAVRKENRAKQLAEEKKVKTERELKRREASKNVQVIEDDDDEDYIPLGKRKKTKVEIKKKEDIIVEKKPAVKSKSPTQSGPAIVPSTFRPTENTSIGGLSVGDAKKLPVVDLTKDEPNSKNAADSREITFNKLQGKTFPSLVVVARPSLKVKDTVNDRPSLDAKVKGVLMHTATKFTEWLIQQGLVRSEQSCQIHTGSDLKLGMYSDASKFPYSGGYVWISECCPTRFVSVFSGSLFEGAPHPPSVLLKLIYHWACQTNVQNVVQWVKVDNLYVKGLYTWLRSVCTVALYQHINTLGGPSKKIEVGVISLGTTSQDGQQRQVKVEVLGVLDTQANIVRLRAVEPLSDGERNYKKKFAKILEPLTGWVSKDSQILTDLTVDKGTLLSMGYKYVVQTTTTDAKGKNCNANIMDYLRRIVPRMFQNTLSMLSRQIIQQFLDELVWREWYGKTPGTAFDNVVSHISEQTRLDAKESLIVRLNKVAANPFKNWAHFSQKTPGKALRDDFFNSSATATPSPSSAVASTSKRGGRAKRRELSPEPLPMKKIKEEPKQQRFLETKRPVAKQTYREEYKKVEPTIQLESYYYGILPKENNNDSGVGVRFNVKCVTCNEVTCSNIDMMNHLKQHANPTDGSSLQCIYCLENWADNEKLARHLVLSHPVETKSHAGVECLICESHVSSNTVLSNHMQKFHVQAELPFRCGCCNFASSSVRITVDHFYSDHSDSGALQCPFCMQIYVAVDRDERVISRNVNKYLEHLKDHMVKNQIKKCNRCALSFIHKGAMKVHLLYDHVSMKTKKLRPLCKGSTKIPKPKTKSISHRETIQYITKYDHVSMYVTNGNICLECDTDFEETNHFTGLMRCTKCKYQTCCLRTMMEHNGNCVGAHLEINNVSPLDCEMHCICGFSSIDGNALARHLATCERQTAYPSLELVQENTVKRNMLDMLGLVRRDDEESDDLLAPVDGDAEERSSNIDAESESSVIGENNGSGNATAETAVPVQYEDNQSAGDVSMETSDEHFNTTISLDDLAPPSVAPPETDRTPQLRDEYQSLATPRVAPIMQEHNEFENLPNEAAPQPAGFDAM